MTTTTTMTITTSTTMTMITPDCLSPTLWLSFSDCLFFSPMTLAGVGKEEYILQLHLRTLLVVLSLFFSVTLKPNTKQQKIIQLLRLDASLSNLDLFIYMRLSLHIVYIRGPQIKCYKWSYLHLLDFPKILYLCYSSVPKSSNIEATFIDIFSSILPLF